VERDGDAERAPSRQLDASGVRDHRQLHATRLRRQRNAHDVIKTSSTSSTTRLRRNKTPTTSSVRLRRHQRPVYDVNETPTTSSTRLRRHQRHVYDVNDVGGWDVTGGQLSAAADDDNEWSYAGSLLYSITVITTIGLRSARCCHLANASKASLPFRPLLVAVQPRRPAGLTSSILLLRSFIYRTNSPVIQTNQII